MPVRLTGEALSLDAVYAEVRSDERGGVVVFSGVVRASEDGADISAIAYEAYEPLAAKELARIVAAAEEEHGAAVAVHHRVGRVPVGEASVLVAAAAAHRGSAFSACRQVIDRLKETAPIWKAEFS
ncbi:MAG: molybdenum cofactor biosynthesis protein MoaE [Elusimicrobia bacterium]|nr:molybdenum cofactor biosynthesis protein MoaE [Elusimicrobiota bacterium]